jgi:hypothetical protein
VEGTPPAARREALHPAPRVIALLEYAIERLVYRALTAVVGTSAPRRRVEARGKQPERRSLGHGRLRLAGPDHRVAEEIERIGAGGK